MELTGSSPATPTETGHYVDKILLRSPGGPRRPAGEYHHNTSSVYSCDW